MKGDRPMYYVTFTCNDHITRIPCATFHETVDLILEIVETHREYEIMVQNERRELIYKNVGIPREVNI